MKKYIYYILIITTALSTHFLSAEIERRAAFDLGSGSIKMAVADVDTDTNSIVTVLQESKIPVPMNGYLHESADGSFPEKAYYSALWSLNYLLQMAHDLDVDAIAGVATAAYRDANNGNETIKRLSEGTGIDIKVITQKDEGLLGFATAAAVSATPWDQLVCWDVGGGSFQMTAVVDGELKVYEAPLGGITALKTLIEDTRGEDFTGLTSPNPVNIVEMIQYLDALRSKFNEAPDWLSQKLADPNTVVVGIGGKFSMFAVAQQIIVNDTFEDDDVAGFLYSFLDMNDSELEDFPDPEMVVPNVALLHAIMSKLHIAKVQYVRVMGNTMGLFVDEKLWGSTNKPSLLELHTAPYLDWAQLPKRFGKVR